MSYRGRWALVTGASSGLGAQFARALAARGANVAATARRQSRLEALVADLRRDHAVEARAVVADLADPAAPEKVMAALADAAPDILVNNAGYGLSGHF
ncbi:MAG: SDR family NAD(P)-dependent oxidoreductase, partial [Amphiplicatus sp.]